MYLEAKVAIQHLVEPKEKGGGGGNPNQKPFTGNRKWLPPRPHPALCA